MSKCDYLVFDISSVLYRTFYAQKTDDDITIAGLASHAALTTLNKYYKMYKPAKGVVMAFDRESWRKTYMSSDVAISKKPYKGNRRLDLSPSQQLKYARFKQHLKELEELITSHTTIITLVGEHLEADDVIAGFTRLHPDDELIIISSDSDLLQLTKYNNCAVISPADGKPQSLEKYDGDPNYYVFHKCIRGDTADNIQSALPGVRSTVIKAAYTDEYAKTNLLKQSWSDQLGNEYLVEDLFEENIMLIDLSKQPEPVIRMIDRVVYDSLSTEKKFSMFHIMKFLTKYQLGKIKEQIDNYIPMLSK